MATEYLRPLALTPANHSDYVYDYLPGADRQMILAPTNHLNKGRGDTGPSGLSRTLNVRKREARIDPLLFAIIH